MNNIVITVDKIQVIAMKAWMNKFFVMACVGERSSYPDLEQAEKKLSEGRGIYFTLSELKLLGEKETKNAVADIERIENKINELRREKQGAANRRQCKGIKKEPLGRQSR